MTPALPINPFQPDEIGPLNQLLDHLYAVRDLGQKCTECGMNVAESVAENASHIQFVEALKRKFFPGTV